MTSIRPLEFVNNALFVGLAGVCYLHWRRQGGRAAAWLALTFGVLAAVVVAGLALSAATPAGLVGLWATKLLLATLLLFPYLLFRFTAALDRPSRRTEAAVSLLAGVLVAWTLGMPSLPAPGHPRPSWLAAYLAALVLQWTSTSLIVAVRLWRAGRGQPTAARRRMRGLSIAAAGLSLVIVVAGAAPSGSSTPLSLATDAITLASALLFYLAFAPPAMLRNAWRQPEQAMLRSAMGELKTVTRPEEVADRLLPHVVGMVGGRGATLLDQSGTPIGSHGQTPAEREPSVRLPLATGWLLVWGSPYTPVFGRQELELLQALGSLADLALERVRVANRDAEFAAALREAKEAADRANKAKSEYLSRMSHELRTPLNAILGFAQLLELEELGEEQRENLHYILSAARHLLGLINEVLDIAAIEAGRLALSLEPVPVADVVAEATSLIRPLADQHNVLLVNPPASCQVHVLGDRQRLKQVLLNLLSNAVKYNRQGGAVRLECGPVAGERVRVQVIDTGPGIPPQDVDRLFVPFERLGSERSGVEGAGLGLPLSRRLAEAMGGSLELTTVLNQGSSFWVELPLAEGPLQRAERQGLAAQVPPAPERSSTLTVLYIEDNLSNLRLVERVVSRRAGIRLISAMRPQLGLDLAAEHHPDLVLLDLHLPDMPGQEVLRRLKAEPRTAEVPVVILSADVRPALIDELLGQGVRAFLTKPLDVKQLLELLDTVAAERDQRRTSAQSS
jgi:signal transduction histidine kinase/ActR/RegA family two-component response regulator